MTEKRIWDCIIHENPAMDFIVCDGQEIELLEVVKILNKYEDEINEQDQKIKELEQELFSTKVEQLDDRLAEYGGPDDEETWKKEFGMSQREAKKKAGWFDWEMYPE